VAAVVGREHLVDPCEVAVVPDFGDQCTSHEFLVLLNSHLPLPRFSIVEYGFSIAGPEPDLEPKRRQRALGALEPAWSSGLVIAPQQFLG
jgi:hypothetical protein